MLDLKYIREHAAEVKENTQNRGREVDFDRLLELDKKRSELIVQVDQLRARQNTFKNKPTVAELEKLKQVKLDEEKLTKELAEIEKNLRALLIEIPNLTHPEVKVSADETENPVLEVIKEPAKLDFEPADHVKLAEKLDLIDFDRAAKIAGAKFYFLKNELVALEFALIKLALDTAIQRGYAPFITPDLAKQSILEEMGFNPRGGSTQVYNIADTDLSLIGTAEITMGGYHAGEVFDEKQLPKKYIAVSHCFRTEAGSYSKFSKGIFRVHQFTKVELFQYVLPDKSEAAHREMLELEKELFSKLEIPYRIVDHTTADLGNPAYRTFDIEAWLPGKPDKNGQLGDWAEMTSTSNCTDYQARGLNIKYQDKAGKKEFVHLLNGTAFAIPRVLIALLENNQQKDGSVKLPAILTEYTGLDIIKPR